MKKRYVNRTIKILSIGNSYSQDAQRYLYGIARADMVDLKTVNLYIGGCSLERHFRNMHSEEKAYNFEINGICNTCVKISLKEALLSDDWNFITIQQQSLKSCDIESFEPYLTELYKYIRRYSPKSVIYLMRTWGYRPDSEKMKNAGYNSNREMLEAVTRTYDEAAKHIGVAGIIPLGDAVALAVESGAENIFRDEIHMSMGFGRYLLGLVFFGTVTGISIANNDFCDFDVPVSESDMKIAKERAQKVVS